MVAGSFFLFQFHQCIDMLLLSCLLTPALLRTLVGLSTTLVGLSTSMGWGEAIVDDGGRREKGEGHLPA